MTVLDSTSSLNLLNWQYKRPFSRCVIEEFQIWYYGFKRLGEANREEEKQSYCYYLSGYTSECVYFAVQSNKNTDLFSDLAT